jgi:hypothetical protein
MVYALAAALLLVGVALFVSAPLYSETAQAGAQRPDARRERLEHERAQAVQGLRELELDRQMNKLSRADYEQLRERLELRALRAMSALEHFNPTIDRGWSITESAAPAAHPLHGDALAVDPTLPQAEPSPPDTSPILLLPDPEEPSSTPKKERFGSQPPPQTDGFRPALQTAFCPACGTKLNARPRFCTACGARVSAA